MAGFEKIIPARNGIFEKHISQWDNTDRSKDNLHREGPENPWPRPTRLPRLNSQHVSHAVLARLPDIALLTGKTGIGGQVTTAVYSKS
jgi:hypothetical protein